MSEDPKTDAPADNVVLFPVAMPPLPPIKPEPQQVPAATEPPAPTADEPTPAPTELEKALAAWCSITVCLSEIKVRAEALLGRSQPHAPTMGKKNARLLVFEDRAEDLAEILAKELPLAPDGVEWWKNRHAEFGDVAQMRMDLRRLGDVVARLEKTAGVEPGGDEPDIDKVEGLAAALIEIVRTQNKNIKELRAKLAAAEKKN